MSPAQRSIMLALSFVVAAWQLLPGVLADLPVHCLRHEIVGEWRFTLGPPSKERSSCGHMHPDLEDKQPARQLVDAAPAKQLSLTLRSPNVASTRDDPAGTWTMVYDEGFEVVFKGLRFFAFSNYTFKNPAATNATLRHNVSHCDQTMVGWYQDAGRTQFGCYYGTKVMADNAVPESIVKPIALHVSPTFADSLRRSEREKPLNVASQKNTVSKLNRKLAMLQLGWRARPVLKWNGRTRSELNSYAGLQRHSRSQALQREMARQRQDAEPVRAQRSFLQLDKLPKAWDWANVSGISYLDPVMDQSDCGSCYAASSTRMLTARHKIKLNDTEALPWSINFPLFCSEYNQGCNGGYGFLLSKWSSDVGLLPATCMRYNTSGSCKLECDLDKLEGKRYRVANHRYVGAFYSGHESEEEMKEELFRNGPFAVAMTPDEDFMYYSDGVYRSSVPKPIGNVAKEWAQVEHGVLLVGWGEDNGQAYWNIQNSWGSDWGEDGFFRILRGQNEADVETMGEAADVIEDEQNGRQVAAFFHQLSSSTMGAKQLPHQY